MSLSSEEEESRPSKGVTLGALLGIAAPAIIIFFCLLSCFARTARIKYHRWRQRHQEQLPQQDIEIVPTANSMKGLAKSKIAQLPQHKFKASKLTNSSYETEKTCMICLCDYEDEDRLVTLACKHSFHTSCAISWLCSNARCPLCNAPPLEPKEPPKAHIATNI
ncbi:hypothetical protein BX667DRAFT_497034 [Coemansia mojavensis]|nr:hypothetical protein BX667DRAFT_497034 [Coemansia mojavensis]